MVSAVAAVVWQKFFMRSLGIIQLLSSVAISCQQLKRFENISSEDIHVASLQVEMNNATWVIL